MRNTFNLLFIAVFLFTGVNKLPACYATKLDCEQKNTSSCPFSNEMAARDSSNPPSCPLLAQDNVEFPTEANFPLERYKRLKIEQILQCSTELPPLLLSLTNTLAPETNITQFTQKGIAREYRNPHFHPPPLFIQFQSFLI